MQSKSPKIIIRSYKRAGSVTTLALFPDAILCVPASQESEYKKYYTNLLVIPDSQDGSSPKKSNAVLNNTDGDIFLLDDDITRLMYQPKDKELLPEEAEQFVVSGFRMAHELGAGLWGVNISGEPMKIRTFSPFSFVRPVYYGVGIIRDNILFDEEQKVQSDVDFYLEKLNRWRKVLRFNHYYWKKSDIKSGGIGKTKKERYELEKEYGKRLVSKWGSDILNIKINKNGTPQLTLNVPIKGS